MPQTHAIASVDKASTKAKNYWLRINLPSVERHFVELIDEYCRDDEYGKSSPQANSDSMPSTTQVST